jgi:hypothetical protein
MIRYQITSADWQATIREVSPTWLDRAHERSTAYADAGGVHHSPEQHLERDQAGLHGPPGLQVRIL